MFKDFISKVRPITQEELFDNQVEQLHATYHDLNNEEIIMLKYAGSNDQ